MRIKHRYKQMIAQSVADLEVATSAEVVLVIRRHSGLYRDLDYLVGFAAALGLLAFFLYSPWDFNPGSFFVPEVLVFVLGAGVSRRWGFLRFMARKKRKLKQVRQASEILFVEKGIGNTTRRKGILLYLSMR